MAETTYIPALSGEEIIVDVCALIAEKLRADCNLRPIDGYAGGYKAKISIHLEMFGLDTAKADYEMEEDETIPSTDGETPEPDEVITAELEIPVEEDLSVVRDRSRQETPNFEAKPEITEEGPIGAPKPRRYSRRLKAMGLTSTAVAQGGAAGPLSE